MDVSFVSNIDLNKEIGFEDFSKSMTRLDNKQNKY